MDTLARPWISTQNPKILSYPTIIGHCEELRDFFKIMKTTFGLVIIADKFLFYGCQVLFLRNKQVWFLFTDLAPDLIILI